MPVRRHTNPVHVKRIWDAIRVASQAHQMADMAKITKSLVSFGDCTQAQAELYVKQTLKDKLIVLRKKSDSGHQSYKIALQELPELDGKDWYCFECHLAGDVTPCKTCYRVFHPDCVYVSKRKFDIHKKNYSKGTILEPLSSNGSFKSSDQSLDQPITIICEDSDDVLLDPLAKDSSTMVDPNVSISSDTDKTVLTFDESLCYICNISRLDFDLDMGRAEVNYMLKFVLHRIRAWLPSTIMHTMACEDRPEWLTDTELTWRANQLFFEHRDMSVIEVKLNTETYTTFSEFLADVYTIQHNVAIFHGIESQEYGASELMVGDSVHDTCEMRICVDCYKHSNEKINNKWFCLPCRVPHRLVWARQKGYPYWPAKVMKETDTHCDVRFFGGKYERAVLHKQSVKPITMSKESLQIKHSAAFNRAYEELKYHQTLLNDPAELEKLKADSKQKRKSVPKQKKNLLNTSSASTASRGINNSTNSSSSSSSTEDVAADKTNLPKSAGKRKTRNVQSPEGQEKRRKTVEDEHNSNQAISGNVIDISDGEEDCHEFSFRENTASESFSLEEAFEQVTSSTEHFGKPVSSNRESGMQPLDQPYSDSVEKMRRKLECLPNKKEIIKCAMDCMQIEVDRISNDHNEHLKRLFESHNQQISDTKRKQWCYNCEQDAIYHCCWNTAYCSQTCQQQHWQAEHKKVCRRKR